MWIKIKEKSINLDTVVMFRVTERERRIKGVKTGDFTYFVSFEFVNESEHFGGMGIEYATREEATEVARKINELLDVKEL